MPGCTGYSWIWIRSVCALCIYLEVLMQVLHFQDAFVVRYAWRMVHPWLMPQLWVTMLLLPLHLPLPLAPCLLLAWVCHLGASENERTRISEPHGNTHLRPSHNDPH